MKKTSVLLAVAALALQAWTAPVSLDQARQAAQSWTARGAVLGARFGASVERASALSLAAGEKVYAVRMTGGGTVFVAADDDLGPVVAFTAATNDFSAVDARSPLWALLNRDAALRAFVRTNAAAQASLRAAKAAAASAKTASSATPLTSAPSDLRVAPLVQSQWDQENADGKLCYNRFTPFLDTDTGLHATCGCVATAMSQIMRYHQFPTASVAPVTRTCYVNIYAATKANDPNCIAKLTTRAGVYDWANMPLVPADGVTDAQCEAIGKLTSDAGISVFMNYGTNSDGASSTYDHFVANALMDVFGYANAAYYAASEISANAGVMKRALFSNFDAGCPVLMGISGDGGHAIVGDGYGYQDGTVYVHLNMGWSGQYDYWYNLPNIDCYYNFKVFDDLVFNIFPTAADGAKSATLSGRVTDETGAAVADAAVRVYEAGTTTLAASGVTSATGVYGLVLPAGTYDVEIEKAGCPVERVSGVSAAATTATKQELTRTIVKSFNWYETYTDIPVVTSAASVGNVWGVDATIVEPRARIVLGSVTNVYATLDAALAAAKAAVAGGAPGAVIEVLGELPLSATATIDFSCTLTTAADAADGASVVRSGSAALAVAAGGTLALSNVTFAAGSSTAVTVASGGRLAVASGVDFGVPSTVAAVTTADAAGFVMADELTAGFAIDCAAALDVGGVFGTAVCDYLTASNGASMVSNARDTRGETRGVAVEEGGVIRLEWADGVLVPLADSAGYFVDASGATNTAARLDRVFEKYASLQAAGKVGDSGEIVIRNFAGLALTNRVAVSGDLTLRGETAGVTIASFGAAAGFAVGDGASLTVRDLAFDGYTGDALFRVDGGSLTVGGTVSLTDIAGTSASSGAIAVLSGTLTVGSADGPVVFDGCVNDTKNSKGGAIYLKDGLCTATLQNRVTITNCCVRDAGGGVYVGRSTANGPATLNLSGYLSVAGNAKVSGTTTAANDVAVARVIDKTTETLGLVLAGALETGSSVGVTGAGSGAGQVTANGVAFLRVAADFTDAPKILQSSERFFNDSDSSLAAAPADDGATLVWEQDDGRIKPVAPAFAVASVTGADGVTAYYGSLADAFGVVTGDATVTVLADGAGLESSVAVTNAVTLTSGAGGPFVVYRSGSGLFDVGAGGSLTVTNVTVDGDSGSGNLFVVTASGALTLDDGATVQNVASGANRTGGAIKLENGELTMRAGSQILSCRSESGAYCCGGAIAADKASVVRLLGGTVADCVSGRGGGVYVGNEATVRIGGAFAATANESTDGAANNLYVESKADLVLSEPFTGAVGYVPGVTVSPVVFGRVASDFSGTDAQIADSAHNFTHDVTGDVGLAMKPASGSGETLLVWSDALDANGNVTVNGTNYVMVAGGATLTAAVTDATTGLTYTGEAQTPTFEGHGFVVTVTAQTNAGDYTATLTPKAGFAWDDGTTEAKTVSWTIAKASYNMSGVTFADQTVVYDGEPHSLEISGTLPSGVTVSYTGNGQTEIGEYTVTATFTVADPANYNAIPALTATLKIVDATPDPGPGPEPVVTNVPTPIAFQSIERLAEGSWRLVVTNRVPWCRYRLLSTDDLTKGFTTTNAWERAPADATPAWTNDVETAGDALFWRAEAQEGVVGEELN